MTLEKRKLTVIGLLLSNCSDHSISCWPLLFLITFTPVANLPLTICPQVKFAVRSTA